MNDFRRTDPEVTALNFQSEIPIKIEMAYLILKESKLSKLNAVPLEMRQLQDHVNLNSIAIYFVMSHSDGFFINSFDTSEIPSDTRSRPTDDPPLGPYFS
jgi:hypothetical protein